MKLIPTVLQVLLLDYLLLQKRIKFSILYPYQIEKRRSRMLERLGYGAEGRRKVVGSRLGLAMRRQETLSINPAVNGYFIRIREG